MLPQKRRESLEEPAELVGSGESVVNQRVHRPMPLHSAIEFCVRRLEELEDNCGAHLHGCPRSVRDYCRVTRAGIDVLTAQEDGSTELDDEVLLDRVTALARLIFTRDVDFLAHAWERQRTGVTFSGVAYAHQLKASIGQCVADLELIAGVYAPEDMMNRVEYLPL